MSVISFNIVHRYQTGNDDYFKKNNDVFKAIDETYKRVVFIKTQKFNNDYELSKAESESIAMIKVSEGGAKVPHIYETYTDKNNNVFFLVMEYIDGKTLRQEIDSGFLDEKSFIDYMIDLCETMTVLERNHISHKDIKPENIIIRNKKAYLVDFNISISIPNLEEGTPIYKAPEMDKGSTTPQRDKADMFSLGVIMYEFYCGSKPIRGKDYVKKEGSRSWSRFTDPRSKNDSIPDLANSIIIKCMKLNPQERYINANSLKADLYKLRKEMKVNGSKTGNRR